MTDTHEELIEVPEDADALTVARATCEMLRVRVNSGMAEASLIREYREWEGRRAELEADERNQAVAEWFPETMSLDEIEQQLLEQLDIIRELREQHELKETA